MKAVVLHQHHMRHFRQQIIHCLPIRIEPPKVWDEAEISHYLDKISENCIYSEFFAFKIDHTAPGINRLVGDMHYIKFTYYPIVF